MIMDINTAGVALPCFKLVFIIAPIGILMWMLLSSVVGSLSSYAYATRLKIEQIYSKTNITS